MVKIGQGKAFSKKWVKKDPSNPQGLIREAGVDSIVDESGVDMRQIVNQGKIDGGSAEGEKKAKELKKRNLITAR